VPPDLLQAGTNPPYDLAGMPVPAGTRRISPAEPYIQAVDHADQSGLVHRLAGQGGHGKAVFVEFHRHRLGAKVLGPILTDLALDADGKNRGVISC